MTGATVGSMIGWWIGAKFSFMTGYVVSGIGSMIGVYVGVRMGRDYE